MRDLIDDNYYYGQIKYWENARKPNSVAIIVESKSDEIFFKKFLDKGNELFSVDGYLHVIEVLEQVEQNNLPSVIGIIDADFNKITEKIFDLKNLFMTDGHDLEMMKINSDAWENIISFYTDENKLKKFEEKNKSIKDYLLNLSKSIANVRFLSSEKKLSLTFRTLTKKGYEFIDYSKFIDKENLSINEDKMLEVIENKSQKQNFFKNNPELKKYLFEISENNYDLYEFYNGHDLINILSLALKKVIGNKNISGQELEDNFTMVYRLIDLEKTKLYSSLKEWEIRNQDLVLFNKKE